MKKVEVRVYEETPICLEDCPYQSDCANHESAGDFRDEDGRTPDLHKTATGWQCSQMPSDTGFGAIRVSSTDNEFDRWWATEESGFNELQPIMILAFRELAKKAWDAAIYGRDANE